jgi:hypothetical protein
MTKHVKAFKIEPDNKFEFTKVGIVSMKMPLVSFTIDWLYLNKVKYHFALLPLEPNSTKKNKFATAFSQIPEFISNKQHDFKKGEVFCGTCLVVQFEHDGNPKNIDEEEFYRVCHKLDFETMKNVFTKWRELSSIYIYILIIVVVLFFHFYTVKQACLDLTFWEGFKTYKIFNFEFNTTMIQESCNQLNF